MGTTTGIEWCDATWNPVGGCSLASPGCTNCYAQRMAGTRLAEHPLYKGTTTQSKAGPVFNGHLTAAPHDHPVWTWPLKWKGSKTPRRGPGARSLIFVGDMSDLFHEDRPDEVIDRVFAVMALCPQHDFQILTKRSSRMRDYLADDQTPYRIYTTACDMVTEEGLAEDVVLIAPGIDPNHAPLGRRIFLGIWPLPNLWLGVSAERQKEADERIPHLLATPAAVRFVSGEPLLGPIDFVKAGGIPSVHHHPANNLSTPENRSAMAEIVRAAAKQLGPSLDQIIAGGESGPAARPMHPDWARSIRDQCQAAGVAFFFKQWGEFAPAFDLNLVPLRHYPWSGEDQTAVANGTATVEQATKRIGRRRAGRLLDGREWSEFPR